MTDPETGAAICAAALRAQATARRAVNAAQQVKRAAAAPVDDAVLARAYRKLDDSAQALTSDVAEVWLLLPPLSDEDECDERPA